MRYRTMQLLEANGTRRKVPRFKGGYHAAKENNEAVSNTRNILAEGMQGIDYLMFKHGIPEMVFENEYTVERMIKGVLKDDKEKDLDLR